MMHKPKWYTSFFKHKVKQPTPKDFLAEAEEIVRAYLNTIHVN